MIVSGHRTQNEAAYRALKATIDRSYPRGHYVAIDDGQISADAATFDELMLRVKALGKDPREGLAVQAGADYPEYGVILCGV